jgi:hypothetical protein
MFRYFSALVALLGLALGPVPVSAQAQSHDGLDCPVTDTVEGKPPPEQNASPFGFGAWHVNEDRSMWLRSRTWRAGKSDKALWIRPQGAELEVSGRRLDAEAPPLQFSMPGHYFYAGFQPTSMTFPTEGCWEVRATAGEKELRFVTTVAPADDESATNP